MAIPYRLPANWIQYDPVRVLQPLAAAKAAVLALTQMPFERRWADELQRIQLKREVAGTSRIEGAEFTEQELEAALRESPAQLETRSQRQAAAAVDAYRWIAQLPNDRPIDEALIAEVHRRLVTGCDDDHCPPGKLRGRDQNVTFGAPRHRGAEGGDACKAAVSSLVGAARTSFAEHDLLVQALALHYHFAAIHPFLDGNGRSARALEALLLQRAGLRDTLFIAMSNYYYEEKSRYLDALHQCGVSAHDLTPFLCFALGGIEAQCQRLFREIRDHIAKALYRNTVTDLFGRLTSPRKRVMSERHVRLLSLLLDRGQMSLGEISKQSASYYKVKNPQKALIRDLNYLLGLQAIRFVDVSEGVELQVNLEWPTQITETEFFRRVKQMPKGRHGFLSS